MSTQLAAKLPALTSLRFFAAATVVVFHAQGAFGIQCVEWGIGGLQAVSFFFVLSGFILCHVYPALDDWGARRRFLVARFARVYPTYLAALVLLLVLIPAHRSEVLRRPGVLAANLLLVQSWLPWASCCFAFNNPSWSIGTEAFFYACFPLLLVNWRRTWPVKVGLAFAALVALVGLTSLSGWPLQTTDLEAFSVGELFHVFPLARVFEFVLGMAVSLAWRRLAAARRPGPVAGTALEVLALALVVGAVLCTKPLTAHLGKQPWVPTGMICWLWNGGIAVPAFAFLILVMALQAGRVSAVLAHRVPVLLGEISYAVYLVHLPLLRWYAYHPHLFASWPRWLCFTAYAGAVLVVSYLMWRLVERPCRAFLVGRKIPSAPAQPGLLHELSATSKAACRHEQRATG